MSSQDVVSVPGGALDCEGHSNLIGNFCADQLRLNADKTVDGDTIFVKTNCETRMPLAPSRQDPAYRKPGVPLDRSVAEAFAAAWKDVDAISTSDNKVECESSEASPLSLDCTHAFASLLGFPGLGTVHGKKGSTWWAGVSPLTLYLLNLHPFINFNKHQPDLRTDLSSTYNHALSPLSTIRTGMIAVALLWPRSRSMPMT